MKYRSAVIFPTYLAIFAGCYYAAFLLRFDSNIPDYFVELLSRTLPYVVALKFALVLATGEWRRTFRYVSLSDLCMMGAVTTFATAVIFAANATIIQPIIPRSVVLIDWGLTLLITGLARSAFRSYREFFRPMLSSQQKTRTLIYGSDAESMSVFRALKMGNRDYEAVGFLAREGQSHQSLIGGARVYVAGSDLATLANILNVSSLIIPANIAGREVRELVQRCAAAGITAHIIPTVDQLIDGRFRLAIREVTISDLLKREPTQLDLEMVKEYAAGRCVLVTGAAGSIGSELCRQILTFGPTSLVMVDHSEASIFQLQQELVSIHEEDNLHFIVADVCDGDAIRHVMETHRPQLAFHAAAYKHVPLMEANPRQAVRNNIIGTKTVIDLVDRYEVERFVLISTDKAVHPSSVMGATKLVAEKYLQAVSARSQTHFKIVRFGNVLNSAGSVVPTFRRQIENGGPITVTHPEMTRFFMTIPEAVQLVLQATGIGSSGDVMILDMGEPVKIFDLAREMISLSGLRYPDDIDIVFSGIRPGEKLNEQLFYETEAAAVKVHDLIYRAPRKERVSYAEMRSQLARLESDVMTDPQAALATLWEIASPNAKQPGDEQETLRVAA